MTCQRIALPGGGVAIVCGPRGSRTICDVCDAPVRKGSPKFSFRDRRIDLCTACQDNRARGDPDWRAFAEKAIAHNLGLTEVPA